MNSEAFINFVDEVYDGSRWHCTCRKTDKGYTKWLQAEPILKELGSHRLPSNILQMLNPSLCEVFFLRIIRKDD